MAPAASPEEAVRRYLEWLDDPASVVDADAVARAESAVSAAPDPLSRLHALADLEHARRADGDAVTDDFVAHARSYAEAHSIPLAAFRAAGVPDEVLARSGFDLGGGRRGGRRGGGAGGRGSGGRGAGGGGGRAPQVSTEEVAAAVLRQPKQFTLADVAREAGGGSPQTVRKAVDELIAQGRVRKVGPKADHHGRGRAPIVYELI
ncbi:MAG: hypothetical protein GXY13_07820 [Acidimicrobiales bacterium]|nr:hypothetical protein [Acidimicrobiales bacterium]